MSGMVGIVALLGIDWSDSKHDVAMLDVASGEVSLYQIRNTPEALHEWIGRLRQRYPDGKLAVCMEKHHGSLLTFLMGYEFVVIYPLNPYQVSRYRSFMSPSGAKQDESDARILLEILRLHHSSLKPWQPDDAPTRLIARLSRSRRRAVEERVKWLNTLTSLLKLHFPQLMEWFKGKRLDSVLMIELLSRWQTLQQVQREPKSKLRSFLRRYASLSGEELEEMLRRFQQARPLTDDEALLKIAELEVKEAVRHLQVATEQVKEYEKALEEAFDAHPDKELFISLPGAGEVLAVRLLSAFGSRRERFNSSTEVQVYCGIAPVQRQSGRRCEVRKRAACCKFLRQSFHEFAMATIRYCVWARAFYLMKQAQGKGYHEIVRALAFKWIRILFYCWKHREKYDERKYIESLIRRGSPVVSYLDAARAELRINKSL